MDTKCSVVTLLNQNSDPALLESYRLKVESADAIVEVKRIKPTVWLLKVREPDGTNAEIRFGAETQVDASIICD